MLLLSIIVPVYNVEDYLNTCLNSLIEYKDKRIEIILVNDGSTDKSVEICENYKNLDSRIKIINKENGGLSDARNCGIKNSVGEFLMFVDSDDFIKTEKFGIIMDYLEKNDTDVVMSPYHEFINSKLENISGDNKFLDNIEYKNSEKLLEILFEKTNSLWPAWRYIVKNDFLRKNNIEFKKGFLHEDVDYTTRILVKMKTFKYLPHDWYCYRIDRIGSIMNTKKFKSMDDTINILIDLNNSILASGNISDKNRKNIRARLSQTAYTTLNLYNSGNEKEKSNIIKSIKENIFIIKESSAIKHKIFYSLSNLIGLKNILNIYNKLC